MVLRDCLDAPDALDAAYRDAVTFSHFRKTVQTMDEYLVKLDLLRGNAEGRMQPVGTFPEASVAKFHAVGIAGLGQDAWTFGDRGNCATKAPLVWPHGKCS